jgi:hypothetical protein
MPLLDKIASVFAGNVADGASKVINAVGQFINTPADKENFELKKAEIEQAVTAEINQRDETILTQISTAVQVEEQAITDRWKSDMTSDSWLSKNVRPLTLAVLICFTLIVIFIDSFHSQFVVKEEWITLLKELLMTVIVAYFGSRGIEKVTSIKTQK